MRVNVFMIPRKELRCIDFNGTINEALNIIEETGMLSLPVVDSEKFIGVLSKQYVFETFFNEGCTKEDFLKKPVADFMKDKVESCSIETTIEDAGAMFISSKVRFIPITDANGNLLGIITQQAIFKHYQHIFGTEHDSITIVVDSYKGALARIAEVIATAGGNICNLVQVHTGVMNISELHIAVDAPDFDKVIDALVKNKADIRNIKRRKS